MLTNSWTLKAVLIVVLLVSIIAQDRSLVAARPRGLTTSSVDAMVSTRELRRSDAIRWFAKRIVPRPQQADAMPRENEG